MARKPNPKILIRWITTLVIFGLLFVGKAVAAPKMEINPKSPVKAGTQVEVTFTDLDSSKNYELVISSHRIDPITVTVGGNQVVLPTLSEGTYLLAVREIGAAKYSAFSSFRVVGVPK